MNIFTEKLKEVTVSVVPITILVIILNFTFVPLGTDTFIQFLLGSVLIIIGLTLFLIGVDKGITPLGNRVGETIVKSNSLGLVILSALVLGFVISFAEPGLIIFGEQVDWITSGALSSNHLLIIVSLGVALLLVLAFLRVIFNLALHKILLVLYILIFILSVFSRQEYLIIAFDASGSTTGVLAVPFILALTFGISHLKRDGKASEKDSFGTIAIVSAGAILSVLVLSLFAGDLSNTTTLEASITTEAGILKHFFQLFPPLMLEALIVILPLVVVFFIFQIFAFRMNMKQVLKYIKGFTYSSLGLMIFLLGVQGGFMDVGTIIGQTLSVHDSKMLIIGFAFLLGVFTILAEPAVHVLTHQIEEVTSGYVTKNSILIALAIGVGLAVMLSVMRVFIPNLQVWHILLPGYIIALSLMFIVPKVFVGIAFDAGGVATGPMTATFILAFTQGAASAYEGAHIIKDGLGMIALVAMTPIITLQILGLIFKIKTRKIGVHNHENI